MLKILLGLGALVVAAIVVVIALAMTRPDQFAVQREAAIHAPPEKIAALIGDFHRWRQWSPYEDKDPGMKRVYGGAASGVGATYEWAGDGKVGEGRMEISEASSSRVLIDLHFIKPFEGRNVAEFTLQPDGEATRVVWAMHGPMILVAKVMSLLFDMDKMIGGDFAVGLARLKQVAES